MTRDLDADQAVCDAATDGPWTKIGIAHSDEFPFAIGCEIYAPDEEYPDGRYIMAVRGGNDDNSAFVIMARTALPEYIAEVRDLRGGKGRGD